MLYKVKLNSFKFLVHFFPKAVHLNSHFWSGQGNVSTEEARKKIWLLDGKVVRLVFKVFSTQGAGRANRCPILFNGGCDSGV